MPRQQRKKFLINPQFQIRFSLIMCSIIFTTSLFYPITLFEIIVKVVDQSKLVSATTIDELIQYKRALIVILVFFQLGFTALTFAICVFISHRIAGPIYKISIFLTSIKKGENRGKLFFRKHDYFKDLAEEYNGAMKSFQDNYQKDFAYLNEVRVYLETISPDLPVDKRSALSEVGHKLGEIQNRYEEKM